MVQVRGLKRKQKQSFGANNIPITSDNTNVSSQSIPMQGNSETRRLLAQDAGKADLNSGNDVNMSSPLTEGSNNNGNHGVESYNNDESDASILKGCRDNRQERTASKITKIYGKIKDDQKYLWLRRCWTIHFVVSTCILSIGILHNYNPVKKYLPINPTLVSNEVCTTAYLNVMSLSSLEHDAIICCPKHNDRTNITVTTIRRWFVLETDICTSKSETLPFASRLAKFPEAWLLPLFPTIICLVLCSLSIGVGYMASIGNPVRQQSNSIMKSLICCIRRLCFYAVLMNVRGWVLYVFFNAIEDHFVTSASDNGIVTPCWYNIDGWFDHNTEQETCTGRPFDFSDHVVLYYAQILPIALIETLYATIENPYWNRMCNTQQHHQQDEPIMHKRYNTISTIRRYMNQMFKWVVPIVLITSHLYTQLITATGAFKTTTYFHTPFEVIMGFLVSMIVSIPLCYIQCSTCHNSHDYPHSWIASLRSLLFRH